SVGHGIRPAHRHADEDEGGQHQFADHGRDIPYHGVAAVILVWRPLRITVATLVERPHMIVSADAWTKFVPGMGGLVEPVQQEHGGTTGSAPVHVVERQAIGGQLFICRLYRLGHSGLLRGASAPGVAYAPWPWMRPKTCACNSPFVAIKPARSV